MALTGSRQITAARALLGWDQAALAEAAGVHVNTVQRIEGGEPGGPIPGRAASVDSVRRALEAAGIEFTNGDAPGVRLRSRDQ